MLVQQANEWLRDNITKETLPNYAVVAPEDTAKVYDLEEETVHDLEYLQTQENVRLELMKVFPPLHEVLEEHAVIDDLYVEDEKCAKASDADETLTEEANRYIGMYSKYYPQTADAFMYSLTDGQAYTVSCGGMRATTVVRTQK